MASLLDDYRRQNAWQNLTRFGQGLLMASAQGLPPGRALASGLSQMQPLGMRDVSAIRKEEEKREQKKKIKNLLYGLPPTFDPSDPTMARMEKERQTASLGGPAGGRPGLMQELGISPAMIEMFSETDPKFVLPFVMERMKTRNPIIRDFKEGDEIVTKRYRPKTDTWEEISRAPRYKPETTVNVEAADPSALADFMTKSHRSQEIKDLRETQIQYVQMVKQGSELIRNLRQSGDQAVSWSGAMARGLDTLESQGKAIAKNFGIRMADGSISKQLSLDDWNWGEMAGESSKIKSQILGLAVAITKADQGSRPSDFDVQTSINRIAGNAGSAARTADVVESLLREKMSDFSVRYNTIAPGYGLDPFDWEQELGRQGIEVPWTGPRKYTPDELQKMSDEELMKLLEGR